MTDHTATRDFAPSSIAPPSLPLPVQVVRLHPADGPIPGTMPAAPYEPHRPMQGYPSPVIHMAPAGAEPLAAAQIATVARSKVRLDRARAYADRLAAHLFEVRARLAAAAEHQVAAAIGTAEADPAVVGPLRGEIIELDRQHRQALALLVDVQAEHARHEADLAALFGNDGEARARLRGAHAARDMARDAVDRAKAVLDRARAHAATLDGQVAQARATERRQDDEATARLHAALRDGDAPPTAAAPIARASIALDEDLRTARLTVDRLDGAHKARAAEWTKADLAVRTLADEVMLAEADHIARELKAVDTRAAMLRIRLHAYAKRKAGDFVASVPGPAKQLPNGMFERDLPRMSPDVKQTPSIVRALSSAPMPPHQGVFARNWLDEGDGWARYAVALASDPEAEPGFAAEPSSPVIDPPLPALAGAAR